jgi:hypothetical protein
MTSKPSADSSKPPTRAELALLRVIAAHEKTPKLEDLASETEYSERHARRLLRQCEAKGLLEIAVKDTPFTPARYRLTPVAEGGLRGDNVSGVGGTTCPPAVVKDRFSCVGFDFDFDFDFQILGFWFSLATGNVRSSSGDQVGLGTGKRENPPQNPNPQPTPPTPATGLPDQTSPMVKSPVFSPGAERAKSQEAAKHVVPPLRTRSDTLSQVSAAAAPRPVPGAPDPAQEIRDAYPARPPGTPGAGKTPLRRVRQLLKGLTAEEQAEVLASARKCGDFWKTQDSSQHRFIKGLDGWISERRWEGWQAPSVSNSNSHTPPRECLFPAESVDDSKWKRSHELLIALAKTP